MSEEYNDEDRFVPTEMGMFYFAWIEAYMKANNCSSEVAIHALNTQLHKYRTQSD
jgi:hypothetical protein